jgi:hypothetical protein
VETGSAQQQGASRELSSFRTLACRSPLVCADKAAAKLKMAKTRRIFTIASVPPSYSEDIANPDAKCRAKDGAIAV